YSAERRLQGRVRPHLGGGARRPAHPARGPEGPVRAGAGTQRQEFGRGSGDSRLTARLWPPARPPAAASPVRSRLRHGSGTIALFLRAGVGSLAGASEPVPPDRAPKENHAP